MAQQGCGDTIEGHWANILLWSHNNWLWSGLHFVARTGCSPMAPSDKYLLTSALNSSDYHLFPCNCRLKLKSYIFMKQDIHHIDIKFTMATCLLQTDHWVQFCLLVIIECWPVVFKSWSRGRTDAGGCPTGPSQHRVLGPSTSPWGQFGNQK